MNIILKSLAISLLFCSCEVLKDSKKVKDKSEVKESIETITYRKGDTVHYEVPVYHFTDTIIYRKSEQGTVLKTVYDKSGNVSSIDCFSSAIEEIKRENREFKNDLLSKDKHKEVTQDFTWLIYVMIGLVIIICFAILLGYFWLKSHTNKII